MTESTAERRERLVETHAYNGLALLTLYDGWRYFERAGLDGFVAFEVHRGVAVACGDPVCAVPDLPRLIECFAEYCRAHGLPFAFVGASARTAEVTARLGLKTVKIGEEPFFELARHRLRGNAAKKARSAINLARRSDVRVDECLSPSPALEAEVAEVADAWVHSRKGPPMAFLLRSRPFAKREKKRIFVARSGDRLVGFITCSPAGARQLLYVEELARRPDAPYGTGELLIEAARQAAAASGFSLFSLGTAPLKGGDRQPYGRFRIIRGLFGFCYSPLNRFYSFRSLNHFKKKFAPTFWEDNFLVYHGPFASVALALITAFSPDGVLSLVLPRRLQWVRLVPRAALWAGAGAGIMMTAIGAWAYPQAFGLPFRAAFDGLLLSRYPAGMVRDMTQETIIAHRFLSSIVVVAGAVAVWRRFARPSGAGERGNE